MKKEIKRGCSVFFICIAAAFTFAGCTSKSSKAGDSAVGTKENAGTVKSIIDLSEAEEIALAHAQVKASDVSFVKTELDYDNGRAEYELEFVSDDYKYEYDINAADGSILKFSRETRVVSVPETVTQGAAPTVKPSESQTEAQTSRQEPSVSEKPTSEPATSGQTGIITLDEAKKIALDHAGLKESDVRFAKAELDYDDGRAEYEIEFYLGQTEYEYEIDASSGMILKSEIDR